MDSLFILYLTYFNNFNIISIYYILNDSFQFMCLFPALEASAHFVTQLFAIGSSLLQLANENRGLEQLCACTGEQTAAVGIGTAGMGGRQL